MFFWATIFIVLINSLFGPFVDRLHSTGLWLGKSLISPDEASAYPCGIQDALTGGWPSTISCIFSLLPYLAGITGWLVSWQFCLISLLAALYIERFFYRTYISSHNVDRFIALFRDHAYQRSADFACKGDMQRSAAAYDLGANLDRILEKYLNSGVPAPTFEFARSCPYGDPMNLLQGVNVVPKVNPEETRIPSLPK